MRLLQKFLRFFFKHLYHSMAWSYDWVAYGVSLGRWVDWVLSIASDIQGPRVLELGHGPGHLLAALRQNGVHAFGLDESWQMSRRAAGKLKAQEAGSIVVNGYAQNLPFPSAIFHQVVATFPSEYILDPQTLSSVYRILLPGGEFLILPGAWITGSRLLDRTAAVLFRITGQGPPTFDSFLKPISESGLEAKAEIRDLKSSKLLIIRARKPDLNQNVPS